LASKVEEFINKQIGFPTKTIRYLRFFHTLTTNVHVSITDKGILEQRGMIAKQRLGPQWEQVVRDFLFGVDHLGTYRMRC